MAITNRKEKWNLREISCVLCDKELGWAEQFVYIWCDQCAEQEEYEDEL